MKDAADLDGFTVSLWVYRYDKDNYYDAFWSFFNSTLATDAGPRLYFTGNSYLGFNDNNGNWFDVNHPETKVITRIDEKTWRLITVTFSKEDGYMFYRDGQKYTTVNMKYTGSVDASEFDWSLVTDFVSSATYFYLGLGSFWGSAEAKFDDLMIYNRALSVDDVAGLYTLLNRVNSFDDGSFATGIDNEIADIPVAASRGIFDLMGRRVVVPGKGIYIVDGKKTMFR